MSYTKDEVLKQSLEALKKLVESFSNCYDFEDGDYEYTNELVYIRDILNAYTAIHNIEQLLAQPVQPN